MLSLEIGKKEAAGRFLDGRGLWGRKGRESLGQEIQSSAGELRSSEDGLCPGTIRLQEGRNYEK